jgi:hypothetical protein
VPPDTSLPGEYRGKRHSENWRQPVVAVHQTQQSDWAVQSCCTTYIQAMQRLRGACRQASVQAHCMIHVAVQHGQCYSSLASTTSPSDAMHADSSLQAHAGLPAWCAHPRKVWHLARHLAPARHQPAAHSCCSRRTCLFHVGSSMQATCSKQPRYGQGCSPACIWRVLVTDRQGRLNLHCCHQPVLGTSVAQGYPAVSSLGLAAVTHRRNLIVA